MILLRVSLASSSSSWHPRVLLLLLAVVASGLPKGQAILAFVANPDPTVVRTKPLNMTKRAASPPKVAWDGPSAMESSDSPTQEWDVDRYQQQHSFVWEYGSSLIDLVLDGEDSEDAISLPSPRVLDVGCGSGELTAQLAKRGCRAVGMDADLAMVQRAREQFKLQEDVDFFQADVRDFSVSEPYDVLFSNAALHWVPPIDVDRAFGCLSHALKPGGKLVVEFGGQGNVETIVQAVRDCSAGRVESPWYFPSVDDVSTRLEAAGIEVTAALLYDRPTPLEAGPDGLANWLRMFGQAFWEQLPATTTVESVLADVSEKCRSQLWDGKQWKADYRRIRVVGRKL